MQESFGMLNMTDKELRELITEYEYTLGYIRLLKLNVATQEAKANRYHYDIGDELFKRYNKKAREEIYISRILNLCRTGR